MLNIFNYINIARRKTYITGDGKYINNKDKTVVELLLKSSLSKNWSWEKFVYNQNNLLIKDNNNCYNENINWIICSCMILSGINDNQYSNNVYQFLTKNKDFQYKKKDCISSTKSVIPVFAVINKDEYKVYIDGLKNISDCEGYIKFNKNGSPTAKRYKKMDDNFNNLLNMNLVNYYKSNINNLAVSTSCAGGYLSSYLSPSIKKCVFNKCPFLANNKNKNVDYNIIKEFTNKLTIGPKWSTPINVNYSNIDNYFQFADGGYIDGSSIVGCIHDSQKKGLSNITINSFIDSDMEYNNTINISRLLPDMFLNILKGKNKVIKLTKNLIIKNYRPINDSNIWVQTIILQGITVNNNFFNIKKGTDININSMIVNLPKYPLLICEKNSNKFKYAVYTINEILNRNKKPIFNIFKI